MKTNNTIEKPEWELLAKYLTGEATPAEQETIENWAAQSEQNSRELEKSKYLLEKADDFYQLNRFNATASWQKTRQHLNTETISTIPFRNRKKSFISTFYKYAAILVIAILLGSMGYHFGFKNQHFGAYSEIISGEKQVVNEYALPDGSVVALNSNSKLHFPKKFRNNVREVTITGEAFFDVVPNPDKPFIINAGEAQIKVLGTSFNVCAYPETELVEIVVETGTVQVTCANEEKPERTTEILLYHGEKGTLLKSIKKLEKSVNTDPNYLAWKTHNLVFENTPLNEVIHYLNKTYYANIQMKGEELQHLVLTAQFEKKPVEFILNVIQLTFNLKLTQENNAYILSEKNIKQKKS